MSKKNIINKNINLSSSVYAPQERGYLEQPPKIYKAKSPKGTSTKLPDPVRDPIVANNISNPEFDYTYKDTNS